MTKATTLIAAALLIAAGTANGQGVEGYLAELLAKVGQGDAEAQYELGNAYFFGDGVGQDHKKAVRWFSRSAGQGHAGAQHALGRSYSYGEGVLQNYRIAAEWYRKAADQENAAAQAKLGFAYATGEGVERDFTEAYAWLILAKAAEQGDIAEALAEALGKLREHMTSAQVEAAQERALEIQGRIEARKAEQEE